jgi:hypothetical protein
MWKIAQAAIFLTGLVLPAPSAFAHGNQFLFACVTISEDGRVALELTADYTDNPNIENAAMAREVLEECLDICIGEKRYALSALGPVRFSSGTKYPADSPLPPDRDPTPHALVIAQWESYLPGQTVFFAAKKQTPHDVVIWRGDQPAQFGHSRWMVLIAGDRSQDFSVPSGSSLSFWWILAFSGTIALALRFFWRIKRSCFMSVSESVRLRN